MDIDGTKKAPNIEVHGGVKENLSGDIKVAHQQQGTKGAIKINIEVER
jgi:hypothetical protein